jgi:hypothetical protein
VRIPRSRILAPVALAILVGAPAAGQDANIMLPVDSIERLLREAPFDIVHIRGSRTDGDRTSRATLSFADGTVLQAQWAAAPPGGEAFNNVPRFEVASYALQKLFLEPPDYVVPPTVVRAFPLAWARAEADEAAPATWSGTESVLVVLQYWLFNITSEDVWDEDRFAADTAYARHLADFNVLTYLVRHGDQNVGNYLVSTDSTNPRVFSVDNGVAFSSEASDRGHRWRYLRVDRLPAGTVDRLRSVTEADLAERLETLAQFRVRPDGQLERVPPTENLDENRGVRRDGGTIQLGLTRREIREVRDRIEELIRDVDGGDLQIMRPR